MVGVGVSVGMGVRCRTWVKCVGCVGWGRWAGVAQGNKKVKMLTAQLALLLFGARIHKLMEQCCMQTLAGRLPFKATHCTLRP